MTPNPARRRILVVARGLDPVGSGRQVELVARGLAAAGWDVRLAVTSAGGCATAGLAEAGLSVHRIGRRPRPDAAALGRLVGLARSFAPEVMLAWGRSQAWLASMAVRFSPAARLVCHVGVPPRGWPTALALLRARRVITTSGPIAAACVRLGVPAARIAIVPPGADPVAATGCGRVAIAERLGLDPSKAWTLCVAPLEAESRLERLLWAIDQLGVVHRRLEHVLVGTGPWRQRVLRRARVQQLAERLHLFPHCDCLPDLLRECRLVWQSGEVSCGGAMLDGMALGIPAVAVASHAARQLIVDGGTGRIVPAEPMSEFPRRALGVLEDDGLAARYGAASRERAAADFAPDRMVVGIMAAIED